MERQAPQGNQAGQQAAQPAEGPRPAPGANASAGGGGGAGGPAAPQQGSGGGSGGSAGAWEADASLMSAMGVDAAPAPPSIPGAKATEGASDAGSGGPGEERSASGAPPPRPTGAPVPTADVANALGGSSQAVDSGIAASVGAHTGTDVSGARVHTGPEAQALAGAVGARALAVGDDIALGAGESASDPALVGHELGHVAQQKAAAGGGSISLGGKGGGGPEAMAVAGDGGDAEHEAHLAGEAAQSQGENAAAKAMADRGVSGPKELPNLDLSRMSKAEQAHAMGTEIRRWSTSTALSEMVDSWPENYVVKMKTPPNVVMSQYADGYRPEVYYDTEYGWSTYSGGNPGQFFIGGGVVQGWEDEADWVTLNGVPKTLLGQPAPDSFDAANTRAEARYRWRPNFSLDTAQVTVGAPISSYRSALAAAPTASAGDISFDSTNANIFGAESGLGGNSPTTPVTVQYTQSVAKTVSEAATGTFAGTTTYTTESSIGVEGSRGGETPGEGGQGKDTWGLKANMGRKWTNTETEMAQRALATTYTDMTTDTTSFSTTYNVPAGVPAVVMVVPVTRKITTTFSMRDFADGGLINDSAMAARRVNRVSEAHVPKGAVAVFGYDEVYYNALRTHHGECRVLRLACNGLRGAALEAKKTELRTKIERFNEEHQPSATRAAENARVRLAAMPPVAGPPNLTGAQAVSGDNIVTWNRELSEWRTFAGAV